MKRKDVRGQSLLETIVALALILMGLVPLVLLGTTMVRAASQVENKTIAVELAREGIEVVRNKRDNSWLQNADWRTDLGDNNYIARYDSVLKTWTLIPATGFDDTKAKFLRSPEGLYLQKPGGESLIFTRLITLSTLADSGMQVVSEVRFTGGSPYKITEVFYDWKP